MDLFGRLGFVIDHVQKLEETYRSSAVRSDNDPTDVGCRAGSWLKDFELSWDAGASEMTKIQSTKKTLESEWFHGFATLVRQVSTLRPPNESNVGSELE